MIPFMGYQKADKEIEVNSSSRSSSSDSMAGSQDSLGSKKSDEGKRDSLEVSPSEIAENLRRISSTSLNKQRRQTIEPNKLANTLK